MDLNCMLPLEIMAPKFPNGFTARDEANAIVARIFVKGLRKQFHTDLARAFGGDVKPRRVADKKLRKLMLEATHVISVLLRMRDSEPDEYRCVLMAISLLGYRDDWLLEGPDNR